jgi:hypothetical protein
MGFRLRRFSVAAASFVIECAGESTRSTSPAALLSSELRPIVTILMTAQRTPKL